MASDNILQRTLNQVMLWLNTPSDHRWMALVKRELFIAIQVARSVQNEDISRRASSLTYHTLLSLVPVMAVAFALFKAFGGFEQLRGQLEEFIFSQLAVSNADQLAGWLESFVTRVNGGAIAGIGLLVLFYSAGGLLTNIEQAMNSVWNVRLRRPLYVRLAIYWCILTLVPPIMALAISMSTSFISKTATAWMGPTVAGLLLGLIAPVSMAIIFFVIYIIVPDTHVPWKNAAISAVVAAVIWNIAKAGFLWTTRISSSYSAIYGAMSALPLLMVWIYTSWFIVLFGAAYSRARGETTRLTLEPEPQSPTPTVRIIARVVVAIWEIFRAGGHITAETVAKAGGMPVTLCRSALNLLADHDLIEQTEEEDTEGTAYVLRRHIGELSLTTLDMLLTDPKVREFEATLAYSPMWNVVDQRLTKADEARRAVLDATVDAALPAARSA